MATARADGLLFLLAVIASTGAAAAPAYILGSIQSLAAGAIPGADPAARVVAVRGQRPRGSDLAADLAAFSAEVSRELDLRGFTPVAGAELTAAIGPVPGLLTDFAHEYGPHGGLPPGRSHLPGHRW